MKTPRRDTPLFTMRSPRKGRVETALDKAIKCARDIDALTDVDAAVVALARAQAHGVDIAEDVRNPWALAAIGRELRETLIRMRLDPASRGGTNDELVTFLRSLANPAGAGHPVGDTENP